jgi:predicted enzyme related to lactoylglutathione lyase
MPHRLRLRTVIFPAADLERTKRWYTEWLGIQPYFDEPFYVGFDVDGFELGLDPNRPGSPAGSAGSIAYWKVADLDAEWARMLSIGAKPHQPPQSVGEGVRVAEVLDPFGAAIGLIEEK